MKQTHTKIAVVGAGAIGSLIGGLLARAGEDVTLIARQVHVDMLRKNGLRIEGVLGELILPVKVAVHLDFKPDLILLTVKTQDVETVCREIKKYAQGAPILALQNGVRSDAMVAQQLGKENVISGVVMLNAQFLVAGEIVYARSGALVIGEAFRENGERVREVQKLLNRAIRTEISDNIQGAHWTKLLVNNVANGLEAMTGVPIRECLKHPGLRRIGVLALKEGCRAIETEGFRLAQLPGVPAFALQLIINAPLPVAAWMLNLSMGKLKTLSSTLQSLKRGRSTEIEYLNGEIVRLGRDIAMPTPFNAKVVEIVKEVEERGTFQSIAEVVKRFPKG